MEGESIVGDKGGPLIAVEGEGGCCKTAELNKVSCLFSRKARDEDRENKSGFVGWVSLVLRHSNYDGGGVED